MRFDLENEPQLKLLIIDDEVGITDLIEAEVEDLSLSVRTINDSKLIRSACTSFDPDVIFLDLGLPDYQGDGVLRFLSVIGCKAKIYLISGMDRSALESIQVRGLELDLNIVGALTKPFTREDLHYALGF